MVLKRCQHNREVLPKGIQDLGRITPQIIPNGLHFIAGISLRPLYDFIRFSNYLFRFFCVSGTVVDNVDSLMNKIDKSPCTSQLTFSSGRRQSS